MCKRRVDTSLIYAHLQNNQEILNNSSSIDDTCKRNEKNLVSRELSSNDYWKLRNIHFPSHEIHLRPCRFTLDSVFNFTEIQKVLSKNKSNLL